MAMKKTSANHFIIIVFLTLLLWLSFLPNRGAAQEKEKEASTKNVEYIDLKISIEIAFPQRDLHIRSYPEGTKLEPQ
jgi:hypothetical protein